MIYNAITLTTDNAPTAVGPYSQARWAGELLFISGQMGFDINTGALISDNVADQARQAMANLAAILANAGLSMAQVTKTTVFLTDMNDFATVNEIYAQAFEGLEHLPARSCVQVAALPKGGKVEIEAIGLR